MVLNISHCTSFVAIRESREGFHASRSDSKRLETIGDVEDEGRRKEKKEEFERDEPPHV